MQQTSLGGRLELAMPGVLLLALALVVWLTVFTGDRSETAPYLLARADDQISGIDAAIAAIELGRNAVENGSATDRGLFAGRPSHASVRYLPLGPDSVWSVFFLGPIRARPNTPDEYTIREGAMVVVVSAFTGELAGDFATGLNVASAGGLRGALGISPEGFVEIPVKLVWPDDKR